MIKEGESRASLRHDKNAPHLKKLGEDICTAGTSIDDDSELLKLGQNLRDSHKNMN